MKITGYIGLGSNLGDSAATLNSALKHLEAHPAITVSATSSFYGSTPHGPQDQPDYTNAVCVITTSLSAQKLLQAMQQIENEHGRERLMHWGARTLDLDLLLYGDEVIQEENLIVPHPFLCERAFVVLPLLELAPALVLPDGKELLSCMKEIDREGIWKLS